MCGVRIKCHSGRLGCAREDGLSKSDPTERGGIQNAECMKRVSLNPRPFYRGVQKAKIKMRIVTDKYGAIAFPFTQFGAHIAKHALQCVAFGYRRAQRMMRIDSVDFQRSGFEVRVFKRNDVKTQCIAASQITLVIDIQEYRCNFQQRIGRGIEAAGFNIDYDRQEAAKPLGYGCGYCHGFGFWLFGRARTGADGLAD
jgi:hypothetical protein